MAKKIGILLCTMMFATTSVFAHIITEIELYEDLSISDSPEEIALLSSLGIISSQDAEQLFLPQDLLTAADLATWVGSYYGLEGTTSTELAQAALAEGLLPTIDGNATYSLVDETFFKGALRVENPDEEMTRDQFAKFMASHIHTKIDGQTLIENAGFTPGPTGVIEKVTRVTKSTSAGDLANIYELTIDGQVYELGMHPRIVAGSADPLVWKGLNVAVSWYGPNLETDIISSHQHDKNAAHFSDKELQEDTVASLAIQFLVIGETTVIKQVEDKKTIDEVGKRHQNELEEQLSSMTISKESKEEPPKSSSNYFGFAAIAIVVMGSLLALGLHKRRMT